MRKLTETQKDFILENFFKLNESPGWRNIAYKLLDTGHCIVAGDTCVWRGGIGNFIKTKEVENVYGCLLYEFDLEQFIDSIYFKEIHREYMDVLVEKKSSIDIEYKELYKLFLNKNMKVIKIEKYYNAGVVKHNLVLLDEPYSNDDIDSIVEDWCESDPSGMNYGYSYEWWFVEDKEEIDNILLDKIRIIDNEICRLNIEKSKLVKHLN